MRAKKLIKLIKDKDKHMSCFGFKRRHEQELYCVLPHRDYENIIRYLFTRQGADEVLAKNYMPSIQFYGFWLVSSDVSEPLFLGDV